VVGFRSRKDLPGLRVTCLSVRTDWAVSIKWLKEMMINCARRTNKPFLSCACSFRNNFHIFRLFDYFADIGEPVVPAHLQILQNESKHDSIRQQIWVLKRMGVIQVPVHTIIREFCL